MTPVIAELVCTNVILLCIAVLLAVIVRRLP